MKFACGSPKPRIIFSCGFQNIEIPCLRFNLRWNLYAILSFLDCWFKISNSYVFECIVVFAKFNIFHWTKLFFLFNSESVVELFSKLSIRTETNSVFIQIDLEHKALLLKKS